MSFVSTADSQSHPLINPKHPFKWRPNPANIVWLCVRRYLRYYFAWMLSILWLLLISWLAFFRNLGSTGLLDETEPLFAEAARQMTVTGDWITPFFKGVPRFDQPPLIYWLMAIAYQTFGVNEFAARLPSAIAGFALTSCCFYTLRYFGTPTEAMGNGCCSTQDSPYSFPYRRRSIQWQSWLVAYLGSAMVALGLRISKSGLFEVGAVIWGASAIAGTVLLLRSQTHWLWGVNFLGFVACLMFVIMPASRIIDTERQLPLRQIAQSIVQVEAPGEELVMITNDFEKPSMVFYTQRPVTFLHNPSKAVPYIQNVDKQSSPKSVLLIATPKSLEKTGLKPNQYQKITHAGIYELVRVSKAGVS